MFFYIQSFQALVHSFIKFIFVVNLIYNQFKISYFQIEFILEESPTDIFIISCYYQNQNILRLTMIQKLIPFFVSNQSPRASLPLLRQANQIVSKILNTSSKNIKFQNLLPGTYPQSKLLNGPNRQTKLVAIFRQVIKQNGKENSDNFYTYFGLFLVDLQSPDLKIFNLLTNVQPNTKRVRDIALHPNNQIITIFYQTKMQFYRLKKQNNQYQIILYNYINYPKKLQISDVQYHPSGDFIIGLSIANNTNSIRPFKYMIQNNDFVFGDNILNSCMAFNRFHYLSKWSLAINKNQENIAIIAGGLESVCILNINKMKITVTDPRKYKNQQKSPIFPKKQSAKVQSDTISLQSSVSILNSRNEGYFTIYDSITNNAQQFVANQTGMFHKSTFKYVSNQNNSILGITKCIDISDIQAIACINNQSDKIQISKIDQQENKQYRFNGIKNFKYVNQKSLQNDKLVVQDIVYNSQTSEICQIYDLKILCFKLNTKCINNSTQITPINKCKSVCSQNKQKQNKYWNPTKMVCQTNQNIQCSDPKFSYDPQYGNCGLKCSKIQYAIPQSEYGNNRKCVCQSPHMWFPDLQVCRYNCSNLPNAVHVSDDTKLYPNQCQCIPGFNFVNKFNNFGEQLGQCKAFSGHKLTQQLKQGSSSFNLLIQKNKDQIFPPWGIVLIALAGITILASIFTYICKKCTKTQKEYKSQEQPETEIKIVQPVFYPKKKKLRSRSKHNTICNICKNKDVLVNCMGPCGHYFHFYCIQPLLDSQNFGCSECKLIFPNRLSDMKFVDPSVN